MNLTSAANYMQYVYGGASAEIEILVSDVLHISMHAVDRSLPSSLEVHCA
jgi:hypothetical protein